MLAFPTALLPLLLPPPHPRSLPLSLWPQSIPHLLPLFPGVGMPCVWWSLGWPSPGSWTPFPLLSCLSLPPNVLQALNEA